VATLSFATELGRGEPMEHCLRQTVLALRIADRIGVEERDRVATYYVVSAWLSGQSLPARLDDRWRLS
jgi:hypothetical protein